jgi:hypothetical protein
MTATRASSSLGVPIGQGSGAGYERTDAKIRSFARLPPGWHYGAGKAALQETIDLAREYLLLFAQLGFVETDAFPGVDGEIMVSAYRGGHCVEVTLELDSTFTLTHQFDGSDRYHGAGLSSVTASQTLSTISEKINQEACATSDWYIPGTTISTRVDSKTWHSRGPAMGVVRQSSPNRVQSMQVAPSARMSAVSIAA